MSIPQWSLGNTPFVGSDGRLTFAGAKFLQQLWERVGGADSWSLSDLMAGPPDQQADTQALIQPAQLAEQVSQLREQVAELSRTDLETQIAQLRETVGAGMRVRAINDTVMVPNGDSSADYTISPPLKSMNALVVFNGSWNVYGAGGGTALLTNTSTLNVYFAVAVPADTYCRFSIVEFL